jgi:succinate-semialdehyde dehydrogenase/glutarate-semialdehyde dehydrogenase
MDETSQALQLLVDGEFLLRGSEGADEAVINPATEATLGILPHASAADLDRAIAGAQRSFSAWRATTPAARGAILKRAADLLRQQAHQVATHITQEVGKPLAESRVEVAIAADTLEWFAEEGRRAYGRVLPSRSGSARFMVVKEPVGVVAAFAPWNFPTVNAARKIGSALAAGCPCILKPAEEAPASALAVGRALVEAGLPRGVLSIVFGAPADISQHLLASRVVRKVSFTGSVPVGRQIMKMAADGGQRTTMELGGHAPVIVFDDVDIDRVLDAAVAAKFRNAGQVCVSPTRFLVHKGLYERFVEGFAQRAQALRVGDGMNEGVQMGPLAHRRRIAAVGSLVDDAVSAGARLVAGGRRIAGSGFFWQPTVLADVPLGARAMNEEPFGPVALIRPFEEAEEAIAEANRLPLGLAAFGFTESARRLAWLGDSLEAGMVGLNSFTLSIPDTPFLGVKDSGHGAENGIEGLEACLVTKLVSQS